MQQICVLQIQDEKGKCIKSRRGRQLQNWFGSLSSIFCFAKSRRRELPQLQDNSSDVEVKQQLQPSSARSKQQRRMQKRKTDPKVLRIARKLCSPWRLVLPSNLSILILSKGYIYMSTAGLLSCWSVPLVFLWNVLVKCSCWRWKVRRSLIEYFGLLNIIIKAWAVNLLWMDLEIFPQLKQNVKTNIWTKLA